MTTQLTLKDAARLWNMPLTTVRRLVRIGEIKAELIDGKFYTTEDEMIKFTTRRLSPATGYEAKPVRRPRQQT